MITGNNVIIKSSIFRKEIASKAETNVGEIPFI
jgi:hypothetical protein